MSKTSYIPNSFLIIFNQCAWDCFRIVCCHKIERLTDLKKKNNWSLIIIQNPLRKWGRWVKWRTEQMTDIKEGSIERVGKERILRKDKKKRIENCQEKTRQTIWNYSLRWKYEKGECKYSDWYWWWKRYKYEKVERKEPRREWNGARRITRERVDRVKWWKKQIEGKFIVRQRRNGRRWGEGKRR